MDRFWNAVAEFLREGGFANKVVVAPAEFVKIFPINRSYNNVKTPSDAHKVDAVVIHKGRYRELAPPFLKEAMSRFKPSFANEVFVVLTSNAPPLETSYLHLGELEGIQHWAHADSGADNSFASRQRMQAIYLGNRQILAETAQGHLIVLPSDDRSITPHVIRDGYFDRNLSDFLQKTLRPGMVYVDVGANVGLYAVLAASCVGEKGRVLAIEAIPRLADMALDNLALNGFLSRSEVIEVAAAHEDQKLTIYEYDRYCGSNTLVEAEAKRAARAFRAPVKTRTVHAKPLTEILRDVGLTHVDLVKVDVEGFELEALQGAKEFLLHDRGTSLILEWHLSFMTRDEGPGATPKGVAHTLYHLLTVELGYELFKIGANCELQATSFEDLLATDHADLFARVISVPER